MDGVNEVLLRGHRFVDYPNDPKPAEIFACRACGHRITALEIQHALFNFACPGCGQTNLLGFKRVAKIIMPGAEQ